MIKIILGSIVVAIIVAIFLAMAVILWIVCQLVGRDVEYLDNENENED